VVMVVMHGNKTIAKIAGKSESGNVMEEKCRAIQTKSKRHAENNGFVFYSTSTHFQIITIVFLRRGTRRLNSIMARNSRFRENLVLPNA